MVLVVQACSVLFSANILLNKAARITAPRCPINFQTLTGMSSGPVALPFFILFTAFVTSVVVTEGTVPWMGSGLWIGGCGNSSFEMAVKYSFQRASMAGGSRNTSPSALLMCFTWPMVWVDFCHEFEIRIRNCAVFSNYCTYELHFNVLNKLINIMPLIVLFYYFFTQNAGW